MKKLILVAMTALVTVGASGCVVTARPGVRVHRAHPNHHPHVVVVR
jgi:hypothetical protein